MTIISSPLVAHAIVKMAIEHQPVAASFMATIVEAHHICPGVDPVATSAWLALFVGFGFQSLLPARRGNPKRVRHWPTQRASPYAVYPATQAGQNHHVTWV